MSCGAGGAKSFVSTPGVIPTLNSQTITKTPQPLVSTPVASPTNAKKDGAVEITIGDNYYDPQNAIVKVGAKIEWWNGGGLPHNVVSLDYEWGTSYLLAGARYEQIFSKPGTYIYMCTLHSGMEGTIQVVD